jgi:hypothetical protein
MPPARRNCTRRNATTQTDAEVNCLQPRVLLEKIDLTRCDPERNFSVPPICSVCAKRITNNDDPNSTHNKFLQSHQKNTSPNPDESPYALWCWIIVTLRHSGVCRRFPNRAAKLVGLTILKSSLQNRR